MKAKWQPKKLGDVTEVIAGQSPEGSFYNKSAQGLPFYQGKKEFSERFIGTPTTWTTQITKVALAGDVLMSVRAPVGPVNFATEKCCIGRGLAAIRSHSNLDRNFLFYFLLSKQDEISGTEGAVFASINKNDIQQIQIAVPALSEQQRIVGILDEAFDSIATAKANAEKNLKNARALFESHLQAVFTQRGKRWVEKTLGDVCILRSGTTLPKEIEKPSGEIPYLKVADMNISDNLNGITCSSRYVNKDDVNASNLLPVGTTIFPKRGGAILTNKKRLTTCVICADLNIMGVTPKRGLLPEFLFNYFLRVDLREINNGSSIPQINNYSIEPLLIAFPESVIEQQAVVDKLASLSDETQRLESICRRKLAALDELKKSLLHKAFSGEL